MKDTELRKKIEGVDALAGGVVYGKEEAWDKLQARLDKPAKKAIALPYKLAAAAAILLLICFGLWHIAQQNDSPATNTIAQTPSNHQITPTPVNPIAPVINTIASVNTIHKTTIKQRPPAPETTGTKYVVETPQPQIKPNPPIEIVAVEDPATPVPPMPQPKKMRVMHINNIGKEETPSPQEAIAYNGPALDISKMKVISIYDVQREQQMRRQEEDVMVLARLNRQRGILGLTPAAWQRGSSSTFASNPFTIHLNRKN